MAYTFYVYKGDQRRLVNLALWSTVFEADGWLRTPPHVEEPEPVLDFSPYENDRLLHIAAVTNVIVAEDATREQLEEAIRLVWSANGKPPSWLEQANEMLAPIPAAEFKSPAFHSDDEPTHVEVEDSDDE